MKNTISVIFLLSQVILLYSQDDPGLPDTLVVSNGIGFIGETSNPIDISIIHDTQIMGVEFRLNFDQSVLSLSTVELSDYIEDIYYFNYYLSDESELIVTLSTSGIDSSFSQFITVYFDILGGISETETYIIPTFAIFADASTSWLPFLEQGTFIINNECALPGDLNQDNVINILDIILIVNNILEVDPNECEYCVCDLNSDGLIDILDIMLIMNIILEN